MQGRMQRRTAHESVCVCVCADGKWGRRVEEGEDDEVREGQCENEGVVMVSVDWMGEAVWTSDDWFGSDSKEEGRRRLSGIKVPDTLKHRSVVSQALELTSEAGDTSRDVPVRQLVKAGRHRRDSTLHMHTHAHTHTHTHTAAPCTLQLSSVRVCTQDKPITTWHANLFSDLLLSVSLSPTLPPPPPHNLSSLTFCSLLTLPFPPVHSHFSPIFYAPFSPQHNSRHVFFLPASKLLQLQLIGACVCVRVCVCVCTGPCIHACVYEMHTQYNIHTQYIYKYINWWN